MNKFQKSATVYEASPSYFFCIVISLWSLVVFFLNGGTAFEWPSIDMGPFFERVKDPHFLPNDFFTNASISSNPRQVFGYFVVFLTKILNLDWYNVFFLLKIIFSVLIPPFIYLFIFGIIRTKILSEKENLIVNLFLLLGGFILLSNFVLTFSIAWWPPVFLSSSSQTFSLFLFLSGSLFVIYGNERIKYFYLIFWASATMVHFSVGVCLISFYYLSTFDRFDLISFLTGIGICIVFPVIILYLFFSSSNILSSADFIEIYVFDRHPRHYLFSEFGTLTSYPWWFSYLLVLVLIAVPFIFGVIRKVRHLKLISFLFFISYLLAPLVQYVGTEVIVSKFIAAFGPIRFSFLGYWMLLVLYGYLVQYIPLIPNILSSVNRRVLWNSFYFWIITLLLIIASYIWGIDDPYLRIENNDLKFYSWIKGSEKGAVFATFDSDYNYCIPLVANRAVFIDNGFPFSEKYFREYQKKRSLLFGSYKNIKDLPGNNVSEKNDFFYESITPEGFISITKKYKLDYIIVKSNAGNSLKRYKPVFENGKIKIFRVRDFKI